MSSDMPGPPTEHPLFEMGNVRGEIELQKQKDTDARFSKKSLEREAGRHTTVIDRFWAVVAVILILLLLALAWALH